MTEYITPEHVLKNLANLPQLVFEVTDACNLKCKYCAYGEFYNDFDKRENKTLPVSKAIRLINYLNQYWSSERNTSAKSFMYVSFYGGEPLMNFNFIKEIVEYVEKRLDCPRRKFVFSMTTNAILLHRYMDYLVEHDFHLLVSLDGNEKNDSYRVDHHGSSSFERVVRNVDLLQTKYPDFFDKNVSFNSVFHNRSTTEEVYRFFKEKYGKIPSISELNNTGIRPEKTEEFERMYKNPEESLHHSEHYEKLEKDLLTITNSYKNLALYLQQYSGNYFRDYTDLLFDKEYIKYIPTGTCLPFSKKMFVTVNGKILPCEKIGHQFGLGQITEIDIELDPSWIANKYNEYYNKIGNQCSHCKYRPACTQCIFNLMDISKKTICYGFMNDVRLRHFKHQQLHFLREHPRVYQEIMKKVYTV